MKRLFAIAIIVFAFTSCKAQQPATLPADSLPEWLSIKIAQYVSNSSGNKLKVEEYQYHQQTVYLINECVGCPDNLVNAYSAKEEVVCQFGGIAGSNTCPDFSEEAVFKRVVWPKD